MSLFEPDRVLGTIRETGREFVWVDAQSAPPESTHRPSVRPLVLLLLLTVCALGVRLSVLQVTQAATNQLLAEGNRIRNRDLAPPRGLIVDRYGEVLAKNVAEFAVELVPADLPRDREQRQATYDRAAAVLGFNRDELVARAQQQGLFSLDPILLAEHLDHDQSLLAKVALRDTAGLRVVDRPRREYVRAPGLAHILGYTGKIGSEQLAESDRYTLVSIIGKTGVEAAYEALLAGERGVEQVEVDSTGHLQRIVGEDAPIPGDTLTLSLDLALQRTLGEALGKQMAAVQARAGAAVAMQPGSGEILAMVALPDYDNNEFAAGISSERLQTLSTDALAPLTNRAIAGVYPSGSVIKPIVAAGGLADGVISEQTMLNVPGEIRIGDFVFPDWKVHGLTDVKKAIAVSSNVFFYAVGGGWEQVRGLGVERLDHYLERFGFGRPTGVDIPGEASGLVPTPEWKERVKQEPWYLGDTYHLAIGQGDLLVTPLQILTATVAIANGGTLVTPHLFKTNDPADDRQPSSPPGVREESLVNADVVRIVRAGMRQGVESGSSRRLQALPVSSAAKTGTAQFGVPTTPDGDPPTHAWFTAFAPYENPEIAVVVLIEGGGAGNEIALPVAQDTLQWYFSRPEEERR
ncbi:penicillin-binding protein 2 [Candidatus Berkelbacteria bacterium]|nr:penicillin-binding protein 2 [Candidatus Berkelbacteria bacterium]